MEDAENSLAPSKKRAAGRQLSRDNPGLDDEEEATGQETGTFKRASDEVLANRRIVKVRRHQTSSAPAVLSSNPFSSICLIPPTISSTTPSEVCTETEVEKTVSEDVAGKTNGDKETEEENIENDEQPENKVDGVEAESTGDEVKTEAVNKETSAEFVHANAKEDDNKNGGNKVTESDKSENEDKKDDNNGHMEKVAEAASLSSFQQLSSSQNAFTGLAGTGFSNSTFSFGSIPKDGSPLGAGSVSHFELKNGQPSYSSFSFGISNSGASSLFGTQGASIGMKNEGSGFPSMQEVPVETGEENEKAAFTADSVLFEFLNGGWKERGKGELKVNVSTTGTGKARLVMRARGNYRLILNASLFVDMKLTNMDKRGITFACVNSTDDGKDGLSTFALKFKDASLVEEFRTAVTEHKGKAVAVMKTPENSPKGSDD